MKWKTYLHPPRSKSNENTIFGLSIKFGEFWYVTLLCFDHFWKFWHFWLLFGVLPFLSSHNFFFRGVIFYFTKANFLPQKPKKKMRKNAQKCAILEKSKKCAKNAGKMRSTSPPPLDWWHISKNCFLFLAKGVEHIPPPLVSRSVGGGI